MARKSRGPWIAGLLLAAAAGVTALTLFQAEHRGPADRLTFQLPWTHTGSFAGYYVADREGHYADQGIDLSFRTGGYDIDPVQAVVDGKAQMGAANANLLIKARAQGLPVRALAAIHQRNPVIFITLQGSGITRPQQFAGKTIHVSRQNRPILEAVMHRVGIGDYALVQEADHARFFAGEVDVWVGFLFYSTLRIESAGHRYNLIHPDNYGIHFYQNCIFATEAYIEAHPDLVRRFLSATLKLGWPGALDDPVAAANLTAHYDPEANLDWESRFFSAMVPLINPGDVQVGMMDPKVWDDMTQNLGRLGLLEQAIEPGEIYSMRFLDEIYGDKP